MPSYVDLSIITTIVQYAYGDIPFVFEEYYRSSENERLLVEKINPVNLRGLKQAAFVLQSLEEGKTAEQIVDRFAGDRQLIEMWTNFLIHNRWVKFREDGSGARYVVTAKGREWVNRLKAQYAEVG